MAACTNVAEITSKARKEGRVIDLNIDYLAVVEASWSEYDRAKFELDTNGKHLGLAPATATSLMHAYVYLPAANEPNLFLNVYLYF